MPIDTQRWSRQTILPELGEVGQKRLANSRVLCIGAGALGSPILMYLAAAGIGEMVIVDPDVVDSTNLQRQILHGESNQGQPKIHSATTRLREINPSLHIESHAVAFTPENAMTLSDGCHVIVDGSDNFPTRYLTNDTAYFRRIPLVHGSVQRFEGQVTVFAPHLGGPCYRCLLPQSPAPGSVPTCAEAGVIGALPGIIGSMQAMETIKLLAGIGAPLIGKIHCYNALHNTHRTLTLQPDPHCALCGEKPSIASVFNPQTTITSPHCTMSQIPALTVHELHDWISSGKKFHLLDVREPEEYMTAAIAGSSLIPLGSVPQSLEKIPRDIPLVVHCKAGGRSARACAFLAQEGYTNFHNLTGGMDAWLEAALPHCQP